MTEPRKATANPNSMLARVLAGAAQFAADAVEGMNDDALRPCDPGHPEYHRRQRAEFNLGRWQTAVPRRYRDATATHPEVMAWADRAAVDIEDAGFLVLTGNIGSGKTHQAYGALRRIAEAGAKRFEMIATTAPDMYGRLRPGGSEHGIEYELRRLSRVPLLLLDDLGTEKLSEWTEESTYRLVNERYNACLPLIITTNLPVRTGGVNADLVTRLGDRLASRLSQTATVVQFDGADLRRTYRTAS